MNLRRRAVVECIGTALLLMVIVGSGIMGERLAGGNAAIALLANSLATGAALVSLILVFGPLSGAHFNPAVSVALAFAGRHPRAELPAYCLAQFGGAIAGVCLAHLMFGLPLVELSTKVRPGAGEMLGEVLASLGLLTIIFACVRHRPAAAPFAVATYIVAAYWSTSSTAFANPAVTLARAFTDTFAGIQPANVPGFIAAQVLGTAWAVVLDAWLHRADGPEQPLPSAATPPPSLPTP